MSNFNYHYWKSFRVHHFLYSSSSSQGHYHHDVRCGDGVIYYSKGQQDVGMWQGAHLVQLKFSVPDASFDPLRVVQGNLGSLDTSNYHQMRGVPGGKGPLEVSKNTFCSRLNVAFIENMNVLRRCVVDWKRNMFTVYIT